MRSTLWASKYTSGGRAAVACGMVGGPGKHSEHSGRQTTGGVFGTRTSNDEGQASGCAREVFQLRWRWLGGCRTVIRGGGEDVSTVVVVAVAVVHGGRR